MPKVKRKGLYFALITALISGVSIFINKFAVTAINEPLIFTTVKNTGVFLTMLLFLTSSGTIKKIKKLKNKEIVTLFFIGIIGGSIPFYLFFKGLSMVSAINGALIHKSLVIWVSLLAWRFLKERMSFIGWISVLTLFTANFLVGGFEGFRFSQGEGLILLATIFWALENVIAKKVLSHIEPDLVVLARMGFGAAILLSISIMFQPKALLNVSTLRLDDWLWIVATTGLLLAYVTSWYRALKYAPATLVSAILVASTLVTNMLSAVFITHTLNTNTIAQSVIMILAIVILYKVETNTLKKLATT